MQTALEVEQTKGITHSWVGLRVVVGWRIGSMLYNPFVGWFKSQTGGAVGGEKSITHSWVGLRCMTQDGVSIECITHAWVGLSRPDYQETSR